MASAEVGGSLEKSEMTFNVDMDAVPDFGNNGELLEAALPIDVPAHVVGGKRWTFDMAAMPKYTKNRESGVFELTGLDNAAKPNLSGLRLTYAANTGIFKGSFRLYVSNAATTPEGRSPRLKRYTLSVVGFVIDGVGHGWATLKNPSAAWPVWVE